MNDITEQALENVYAAERACHAADKCYLNASKANHANTSTALEAAYNAHSGAQRLYLSLLAKSANDKENAHLAAQAENQQATTKVLLN